jgi:hypothetical protein
MLKIECPFLDDTLNQSIRNHEVGHSKENTSKQALSNSTEKPADLQRDGKGFLEKVKLEFWVF